MELLLGVIFFVIVAVLAQRFGYDSRDGIQSKEAELACFGMQWPAPVMARTNRPLSRRRRLRRRLARALLAFADWLYPTGAPAPRTS